MLIGTMPFGFVAGVAAIAAGMSAGEGGDTRHRHWHFLGSALTLYISWQAAVLAGIVMGANVPPAWSLDFAVVLSFIAILVPVVKTRANLAAALVAAAIALAAAGLP